MEKRVLWDNGIKDCMKEFTSEHMLEFMELLDYIKDDGIESIINRNTQEDPDLWDWLYTKDQTEMNDIKKELGKKIQRAKYVDSEEFDKMMEIVGKLNIIKTLILLYDNQNDFCVSTKSEYYAGLRRYLIMEKKDSFCKDLSECFPHIHFSHDIERTINTLNKKFEEIREEIVEHLTQIDGYQSRFEQLLSENKSFQEIAQHFSMDTGIECSPQAGRKKVQALKEKYFNSKNGQEETVTCELHTKFKRFNIDIDKQDRIYFFPGKREILEGKVIVKHIGGHL
ncbi:hypothetical protein GN277_26570 [Lachnospiraceae bacterium WCA-9-b2]|uniref:Uncharacterized protein n=1 Tax=Sporofaciens musculi TaxID=2681861 RepID=A0A7X3SLL1_9FIRM|nr:hypothetical protein [Sporofaciens musculi]MCI9421564.1 hypothetical protein [Dorea sp.]MXP78774.1 hypothetical protein [Sporofaciens musculi]